MCTHTNSHRILFQLVRWCVTAALEALHTPWMKSITIIHLMPEPTRWASYKALKSHFPTSTSGNNDVNVSSALIFTAELPLQSRIFEAPCKYKWVCGWHVCSGGKWLCHWQDNGVKRVMKYLVGGHSAARMTMCGRDGSTGERWQREGKWKSFHAPAVLFGASNHKSLCHMSADKRSQAWKGCGDVSGGESIRLTAVGAQQGVYGGYSSCSRCRLCVFFSFLQ